MWVTYSYDLSIISPVYNEEGSLRKFIEQIYNYLDTLSIQFEIILIDDCSKDNSWLVMNEIIKSYKNVSIIQHKENKGHVVALESGFRVAKGEWFLTLDSDLQHPPSLIPKLWELRMKSNVISTRQIYRKDKLLKKLLSLCFYPLLHAISGIKVNPNVGDFRLIHSDVILNLLTKNESKIIRFQLPKYNVDEMIVDYQASERFAGQPGYNLSRMFRLAEESLIMLTRRPLYWGLWFSIIYFLFSAAALMYGLSKFGLPERDEAVLVYLMAIMFFMSAPILLSIGMLGLYLSHLMNGLHLYPEASINKIKNEKSE